MLVLLAGSVSGSEGANHGANREGNPCVLEAALGRAQGHLAHSGAMEKRKAAPLAHS